MPYELVQYKRSTTTNLAPESLKAIHPLGKSPVIEIDGQVIAESGAIVESIISKYAPHLAPSEGTPEHTDYLQWIHFSESSAMLPFLLKVFNKHELQTGTKLNFLTDYAETEFNKVFAYLNNHLEGKTFLVGNTLTGADFMLGFVVESALKNLNIDDKFLNISAYIKSLEGLDSHKRAMRIESQLD